MTTSLNGGRGWLADAPAASIHRMDKAYGGYVPVTSAGRTYQQQADAYYRYKYQGGPLALPPGTSLHETGKAIDFGSSAWGWLGSGRGLGWNGARANGFGWRRTVSSESWHFEYDQTRDLAFAQAYLGITADGINGPQTISALKSYQSRNGLVADGVFGPATLSKMLQGGAGQPAGGASSQWPANALYGEAWVRSIQEKLNKLGYNLTVDGQDGPATQAAVKDFQSKQGISPVDGIAGPVTNNKLDAVLAGSGSSALVVDGEWGASTTSKLQSVLGVTVDGQLGPETIKALQARLKVDQDGALGPNTTLALQKVIGATQDGIMGPGTVKALQTYLNSGGTFETTPETPTTPPPSPTIQVDGELGPETIKALQTNLKVTPVDGELGPITIKAMQTALGVTADGEWGAQTTKALQTLLGVVVDGQLGPNTIKALQNFLNANGVFKAVEIPAEPEMPTYPKPAAPTYPDADWWDHSPNCSPRRAGDKVQYFVVHHAAATSSVENLRNRFMNPNDRKVSPNWLIGADGSISEIVPPDNYRAWTSGQFDYNAVTVETQNTSGDPNWGISAESHEAIAQLVAWSSKRYGFPIDATHVIGHRDVPGAATACPGPSMKVAAIIARAQLIAAATPDPEPEVPEEPTDPEIPDPPVENPDPTVWTITLPTEEAEALGKLLDEFRKLLP